MTASLRLPSRDYLAFLDSESARFTDLLTRADPDETVPSCPDWSAADLLWHLTEVQWFWGSIVGRGLHDPADAECDKPQRPASYSGLLGLQLEATDRLLTALGAGDDADPVWTWLDDDQTRGFVRRRQAHEVLIHRLDAEQLVGEVTPLDEKLAADGVDEALRIMFGGTPAWAEFHWQAGPVAILCTDTGARWSTEVGRLVGTSPSSGAQIDEPSLEVHDGRAADPVAQIAARAEAVDAWLWGRLPAAAVDMSGDPAALGAFTAVVATGVE
ncbi:MAG TPA: maleylpyruvate isomerase family mycothiol-dependent enzyme [Nocardioidaceae bacterium]|jgi:uncharacterized protein (TIGR03083 family)|nr:maleylpyruvate isomerase family mycothiol-dependent enzyme [Nocardioidaceae bacterium]